MKESAVTKFLAETVMGWNFIDSTKQKKIENALSLDKPQFWETDYGFKYCLSKDPWDMLPFDPIHRIEHAFMVRDAIRDTEDYDVMEKYEDTYRRYNEFDEIWDVSAERLSLAAVRALATEDQIEEWL